VFLTLACASSPYNVTCSRIGAVWIPTRPTRTTDMDRCEMENSPDASIFDAIAYSHGPGNNISTKVEAQLLATIQFCHLSWAAWVSPRVSVEQSTTPFCARPRILAQLCARDTSTVLGPLVSACK